MNDDLARLRADFDAAVAAEQRAALAWQKAAAAARRCRFALVEAEQAPSALSAFDLEADDRARGRAKVVVVGDGIAPSNEVAVSAEDLQRDAAYAEMIVRRRAAGMS